MRADPCDRPALHPRQDRSHSGRLREALADLCGGHGQIVRHAERNWASATFAGTRHTLELVFTGPDEVSAGENFVAALPDHEFTLPRQLVADAAIVEVDHALGPPERLAVTAELLLLDEY